MKLILTDVDEVLLNWRDGFAEWIQIATHHKPKTSIHDAVDLVEWLGCSEDRIRELIFKFNTSTYFTDLKPYSHASEYVPKLVNLDYKFIAISACSNTEWTHTARWKNLTHYFPGAFIGLHCVGEIGTFADKFPFLNLYKPAIWIDDHVKHAQAGVRAGHTTFLMNYIQNSDYHSPHIIRVNGWGDIYEAIEDL